MHGMVVAANTRLAAHHRVNSNCPGRSGERAHSSPFPSLFSVFLSPAAGSPRPKSSVFDVGESNRLRTQRLERQPM